MSARREPVKDFREVFKDYYESETQRVTEILGALSITEDDGILWQRDTSSNVIDPHCIYGIIPDIGVIKIGTNPSFPESIYLEVSTTCPVKKAEPNLVWFRGRMSETGVHFDEGAVLFQHEYLGNSLRPIIHFDAEQLASKERPAVVNNHLQPIAVPKILEEVTLKSAGEVFFDIARVILGK